MINPGRFNELGKALSRRFFAGEAVLVLSKLKKKVPLSSDDNVFLKEIKNFFESAMAALGGNSTELAIPEISICNTLALYELSLAIQRWRPRANFRDTVTKLISIAASLSTLRSIGAHDLQLLIDFFIHLDCHYAERSADLLE